MKRIAQSDLQQLYEPMPDHFASRVDHLLAALPAGEEKIIVKKKISAALALALALILLAAGALAAALNWDAILALYGHEKPELESLLVPVNQSAEAGGVTLEIASALTDGRTLVLDWTLRAEDEALPVYIETENLTTNGNFHWTSWGDGLQVLWLQKGEKLRQSGEIIALEAPVQPGETIAVELTLHIARPKRDVVFFDAPEDASAASALREQGLWAAVPLGEVLSYRFDAHNVLSETVLAWNRYTTDGMDADFFDHHSLTLSFDVTVPETAVQPLYPACTQLALEDCSWEISEAVRTPLGLYITAELISDVQATEDDLAVARILNPHAMEIVIAQDMGFVDYWAYVPEPLWQGEDGRLHKQLHASMIGYQSSLLQQDVPLMLSIGKFVQNEDGHSSYYSELHRFPLLFAE